MAKLIVRGLDDETKRRLQRRAEAGNRSLEAEVREILRVAAFAASPAAARLGSRIAQRFAGLGLTKTIPEMRGEAARAAQLED
jgi:plasmid stability protein